MMLFRACFHSAALASIVLTGCAIAPPDGPPSVEQLAGAVYTGIYDEPVQLSDGVYEGRPFVPGGASRPTVQLLEAPTATGELDDRPGQEAAVLLVENSGGSGSFVYLAVVGLQNGEAINLGTAWIGDRSRVEAISIEGSRIRLELLEHGPGDPACCPSREAEQSWVFRDGGLVRVANVDPGD